MANHTSAALSRESSEPLVNTVPVAHAEIKSLTSLRGIAAIIVVIYHFRDEFPAINAVGAYTSVISYGWIMVDFFFLLSGFVMMIAYSRDFAEKVNRTDYFRFIRNRLARVYPLHIFMLFCFLVLECGKYVYLPVNLDPPFSKNYPSSIITNLLLIQAWGFDSSQTWNWASWSISAEFAAYLLFPFIVLLSKSRIPYINIILFLFAVAILYVIEYTIGKGSIDLTYNFGMIRCLSPFIIGVATFNLLSSFSSHRLISLIRSSWMLYFSIAFCLFLLHSRADAVFVILSFSVLVAAATLNNPAIGSRFLSSSPLHFLGVISYSIYMTHSLILRLWRLAVTKMGHGDLPYPLSIASMMFLLLVVIALSWLTFTCIESPGRRFLKAP